MAVRIIFSVGSTEICLSVDTDSGSLSTPTTPNIISINTVSTNEIELLWNDVANETSYTLFRSDASNDTNTINFQAGTGANTTNYNDTGLNPGTEYYYWVKACSAIGSSRFSSVASNKTLIALNSSPNPPTTGFMPSSGVVLSNTNLTIHFDWDDGIDPDGSDPSSTLHYIFRLDDDSEIQNNYDIEVTIASGVTFYSNVLLQDDKHYVWAIKTVDDEGDKSAWSQLQYFYLITTRVNTPIWTGIRPEGWDVYLSWELSIEPQLAGYIVYRGIKKGIYGSVTNVGNVSDHVIEELDYNIPYYITILAYDLAGRESEKAEERKVMIIDMVKQDKGIMFNSMVNLKKGEKMELMWKMEKEGDVEIIVYSRSGRLMKEWKKHYKAGPYTKRWDCKQNNKYIGAGVHYVVLKTPEWEKTLLMGVIK